MKPFHVSWQTRDRFAVPDYKLYTAIASAATFRQFHGSISLISDMETHLAYRELGIDSLYDTMGFLDMRDDGIDYLRLWAGRKITAWESVMGRGFDTCVDQDVVIWLPLNENPHATVQGLHYDDPNWKVYRNHIEEFRMWVPELFLDVPPLNAGVLTIREWDTRDNYLETAKMIMHQRTSLAPWILKPGEKFDIKDTAAMVFAEQSMASAIPFSYGKRFDVYFPIRTRTHWRVDPKLALHVQGLGAQYEIDYRARWAYLAYLMDRLKAIGCQHAFDLILKLRYFDAIKSVEPIMITNPKL